MAIPQFQGLNQPCQECNQITKETLIKSFLSEKIPFPEVFLGLVSAVGANVSGVVDALTASFEAQNYRVSHIKISKIMKELEDYVLDFSLVETPRFDRINSYIDFGNEVRKRAGKDIFAAFAIQKITEQRELGSSDRGFAKHVYIIDQLKTEDELKLLRQVYGRGFFQVSVYSARDIRVDNLARQSAHDNLIADRNRYRNKAEELVTRDEDEADNPFGQRVGKIFQLADVVVNADRTDDPDTIAEQVRRFVELLFGANSYSPTRMEYGMHLARSAALRSVDLSRQVGAAIFRKSGEIATLGSNEVPKAGGGTYWADDSHDAREFRVGHDSNDKRKEELLNEILTIALGKGYTLPPNKRDELNSSQFMDALEYGRIVHAEMSAISDAARLGVEIAGGTLYCTAFPCHMCSKHIVASGIAKVVFLEPYPKSLTADLHSDSVKIEGTARGMYDGYAAVNFVPFYGITPRRYHEFFLRGKRKAGPAFREYQDSEGGSPSPIFTIIVPWYAQRESEILLGVSNVPMFLLSASSTDDISPTE